MNKNLLLLALILLQTACTQTDRPVPQTDPNQKSAQKTTDGPAMPSEKLTNPTVRAAIVALEKGDSAGWLSLFSENPELFDDGAPRDFKKFSADAVGHERFTSIDKTESNGLALFGNFHSDRWGDAKVYFRFHINAGGKIDRLEIGRANY